MQRTHKNISNGKCAHVPELRYVRLCSYMCGCEWWVAASGGVERLGRGLRLGTRADTLACVACELGRAGEHLAAEALQRRKPHAGGAGC